MAPYLLLLCAVALTVSALDTADLEEQCGHTWRGDGLLLRSHAQSRRFYFVAPDTDCWLWVQAAAPGDRIHFQFHFFLVYSLTTPGTQEPPAPADPCAPGSYLQFYEGHPGAPRPLGTPLCGLTIPVPVTSSGPLLGLRLVTRGRQPRVDFVGAVTSFHLGFCDPYFRCRNGRCIPPSLRCDVWDVDNCGDGSDQEPWPPANCRGASVTSNQTGDMANATSRPRQPLPLAEMTAVPIHTAALASQDAAPQDETLQAAASDVAQLATSAAGILAGSPLGGCSQTSSKETVPREGGVGAEVRWPGQLAGSGLATQPSQPQAVPSPTFQTAVPCSAPPTGCSPRQ
ncbi:low-density lipoprotein receptor class A domain-containing protein 2 [Thomomys bottae]